MQDLKQQEEKRATKMFNFSLNHLKDYPMTGNKERFSYAIEEVKKLHNYLISLAVKQEKERCINIILRRTEIPKGARNPTRDETVVLGEHLVDLIKAEA